MILVDDHGNKSSIPLLFHFSNGDSIYFGNLFAIYWWDEDGFFSPQYFGKFEIIKGIKRSDKQSTVFASVLILV